MNKQIYEEASEWLVELRVGDIDGAARERLDTWFRASPEHIDAFLELASIWEEGADPDVDRLHSTEDLIARVSAMGNVVSLNLLPERRSTSAQSPGEILISAVNSSLAATPAQPMAAPPQLPEAAESSFRRHAPGGASGAESQVSGAPRRPSRRLGYRRFGLAASVAFISVALGALALYNYLNPVYSTGTGEQRTLDLADGSRIELNARSRIRVRFSKGERDVDLLAGQAFFQVAKDASRPFVVASDDTRVRAVGTRFDVYRKPAGTTVTVVEGRVAVLPTTRDFGSASAGRHDGLASATDPVTSTATPTVLVSAGEQVIVTPSRVSRPVHPDVVAATAWTQRELMFDSTPLSEVAQEFSRYNVKPLIVNDEKLKDFHVTGVFSSADPASLLKFLRTQHDIEIVETESSIQITGK